MGSLPPEYSVEVDNVCIIGAGPSGLAAAKYFLAERAFSHITIYEQRTRVGGLWNHIATRPDRNNTFAVPETDHDATPMGPNGHLHHEDVKAEGAFMSPVYDRLETNIPRGLMGFSDLDWPEDCQLFPEHEKVLDYIDQYAEDVKHLIQFNTQVVDVSLDSHEKWRVKIKDASSSEDMTIEIHTFDAVLVANGHFNIPYVPEVTGMRAWSATYPGSIIHSMYYRKPEDYNGKKVVVVGNSASGVDIAAQIATASQTPLLQSQKSISQFTPGPSLDISNKPEIVEYITRDRALRFADETIEKDIDAVVYCTGYFYSFPFLKTLHPPVVTTGECVEHTFQHIFYRPHPTLAFAVLNQKVIPFPMAEAQSAVIARVWSGRLDLPSESEMHDWERETLEETGGGRNFHFLKFPKDADYINMLHDWAMTAKGEPKVFSELRRRRMSYTEPRKVQMPNTNGVNKNSGKEPPYWGEKEYWMRERFPAIKKAFQDFGEERHSKRTLENVGFSFEEWKKAKIEEGRRLL